MDASAYVAHEALPDGRALEIRACAPADRDGLLAALDGMSDRSIQLRFFAPKRKFSESELAYYTKPDFAGHVALVAELAGRIVGGARYVISGEGAEVAFAVVDDCQGLGLGTRLLRHLVTIARARGIARFVAEVLPDNRAMLRVFARSGFRSTTTRHPDALHIELQLDQPTDALRPQEQSMNAKAIQPALAGQKALIAGIANEHSIAYGCARAFRELGAEVAVTYLNEKAKQWVEPLAKALDAPIFVPLDVSKPGELEAVFERIGKEWGKLDIVVHSIASAPKEDIQGKLIDSSAAGFAMAMDISCHSFIRMARLAAPLMKDGGSMFAMSYLGAEKVVPNYNLMGPVKAALEASCRYLAYELGPQGIRVHPISPGPLKTRAASGLKDFDLLLNQAVQRAPVGELVDIMDVGFACAYLATKYARRITGNTLYVDGGVNIMG